MGDTSPVVLLVDDEPMIRRLVLSALKPLGCTVFEAGNGAEAIRIFKEHSERIKLVLTDIVMPGIHGDELAAQLLELRPDLPVVFVSAYCSQIQPALRHCVCLEKPFRVEDVRGIVADFLGAVSQG